MRITKKYSISISILGPYGTKFLYGKWIGNYGNYGFYNK